MANTTSDFVIDLLLPIIITLIASSSFWLYVQKRFEQKNLQTQLLIGLAHDRIVWLGMFYITRGWITQDEYENLNDYLFKPYNSLGGNGSAKRIMMEIDKLQIRRNSGLPQLPGDKPYDSQQ